MVLELVPHIEAEIDPRVKFDIPLHRQGVYSEACRYLRRCQQRRVHPLQRHARVGVGDPEAGPWFSIVMAARTMVSYDDITSPYQQPSPTETKPFTKPEPSPPRKKMKRNNHGSQKQKQKQAEAVSVLARVKSDIDMDNGVEDLEEESRELTQEEIWDDSALVDAWDAANEEYEAYHSEGKSWKDLPITKSALWYNIPPSDKKPSQKQTSGNKDSGEDDAIQEENSRPFDFETFVPAHDPSLYSAVPGGGNVQGASDPSVSADEAFNRAMSAMYWTGYWTAVYQHQRSIEQRDGVESGLEIEEPEEDAET